MGVAKDDSFEHLIHVALQPEKAHKEETVRK
jgi:hypothetical protein